MMKSKTDPAKCHEDAAKGKTEENIGCNSGMLLYWILKRNGVRVKSVSQIQLPIARARNLAMDNHNSNRAASSPQVCIRDWQCRQSKAASLQLPGKMEFCEDA